MKKAHTINEFLEIYRENGENPFIGKDWDSEFVNQLVNDFGIPADSLEFVGCIQNEYYLWNEYMILYRFPKKEDAEHLGSNLKLLGTAITRFRNLSYDFGIQEIDPARSDGYYILLYGIKEKE